MRIDLKTGFQCNNRCRFCVQGDRRTREPDRSTAQMLEALEENRAHGDELVLTGGEISLRRDLGLLIRRARALGYREVQLQSNGRRFAVAAFCEEMIAAGVTEFGPSLHGARPETHEALTRAPGSWRQTVQGIRNLRARGQRVITNSVVTRSNLEELPELARLLVALGVSQYQLAMVHPLGTAWEGFDQVVPRLEEAAPWVRKALVPGLRAGIPCMVEAMPACLMRGLEDCMAEARIPATRIDDPARLVEDYRVSRLADGKAKGPGCARCTWTGRCEGPWREYPQRHGWGALQPRSDLPV